MKTLLKTGFIAGLLMLAGCVYDPYGYVRSDGYYGDAYYGADEGGGGYGYYDGYDNGYYAAPGYYGYGPGYFWGPAFGLGIFYGGHHNFYHGGHDGHHDGGHGGNWGHGGNGHAPSHGH